MTIIYFILILSVVISIHEFGHFLFAKKNGVYVYEFSIGMGPRLFKFNRKNDETDYSIRLLPIGGYVQMAGESPDDDKKIPKEKNMTNKKWHQKVLIVIAGILFNFLLAIVLLFIIGLVNGNPTYKPILDDLKEEGIAYQEGLRNNDLIIKVDGIEISSKDRFILEYSVLASKGKEMSLVVLDENNKEKSVVIKPKEIEQDGKKSYDYGIDLKAESKKGILEAIKYAFTKFVSIFWQLILTIWYLIIGKIDFSSVSGPVGIFSIVGEVSKQGFLNVVYLTAYLSLNLGFMNFLPIPALDGGRLFLLIIEKIIRRPINPKVENIINTVGFILLMGLIVLISFKDILNLF